MSDKVKLGKTYKDTIHGIEGVATARSEYLTGCNRVCLEFVKEGEIKTWWFDEPQLVLVKGVKPKAKKPEKPEDRGGPAPVAPSRDCPSR